MANDAFYQSIEFAFQATGAQAVLDLEANVQRLKLEIANYQAQLRAGTVSTVTATADMQKLAEELRQATEAAAAANRVMAGLPASLASVSAASQSATRGMSQAFLEFSRGVEDFAVAGPLGALNNLPRMFGGIAQAMKLTAPQVAAVETAASLLGTTLYVLWQNSNRLGIEWDKLGISWDTFQKAYGLGLPVKPLDDVKDLQEQLKTLTEKTWTTRVEVQDMGILKEQIEELERAKRGLQGLGAADEATKTRGKIVTDAVVEAGGRKKVVDAVLAATAPPESPEVKAMREKIEGYQRNLEEAEKAGDDDAANFAQSKINDLKSTKEGTQAVEMQNRRTAVDRQFGLAGSGDEAQARWLRDLFEKHPEKFEAQGVDMNRLGAGLENAADPMAEARRKAKEAQDKKSKEAFEKRTAEQKDFDDHAEQTYGKFVNEGVAATKGGFDDALQKKLFDAIKGGARPEDAMAGQKADLTAGLKGRVADAVVGSVADVLLRKAADGALNLINEGQKPRLDVKAAADRKQAITEEAQRFGPGLDPVIRQQATEQTAMGHDAEWIAGRLQKPIERRLAGFGLRDDMVADVARQVIEKAMDKASNAIQRGMEAGGGDAHQSAQSIMAAAAEKQQAAHDAHLRTQAQVMKGMGMIDQNVLDQHRIQANAQRIDRALNTTAHRFRRRPLRTAPPR